jgi:hypothetical protein
MLRRSSDFKDPRANLGRLFMLEPAEDISILINQWTKPLIPTNRSSER